MPLVVENKCCKLKKCITSSSQSLKFCLDTDVLQLFIGNTSDIRNNREDNITVQGLFVKQLTDSLFWLDMDIYGKATTEFVLHV